VIGARSPAQGRRVARQVQLASSVVRFTGPTWRPVLPIGDVVGVERRGYGRSTFLRFHTRSHGTVTAHSRMDGPFDLLVELGTSIPGWS
jgi:hypothetical protein